MRAHFLMKFIFVVILWFLGAERIYAQNSYVPNVLPPSPNAAALMKFSDIPVSLYTGTADVTVPIYTIQARGLTVPISVEYHTGGIKVSEEASSVGLGWALSAGGSISRTIMDKDDFNSGYNYFGTYVPQLPGDLTVLQYPQGGSPDGQYFNGPYLYSLSCTDKILTTAGTEDFYNALSESASLDFEPDLFNYNFGGHMGKFMLTRTGGIVLQRQDNIRISYEMNGNSFTIWDERGNQYYFAAKDTIQSSTGLPASLAVSSWNISRIVTNHNDTVSFSYFNDGTYTTTLPEKNETWNFGCTQNAGDFFGNRAASTFSNGTLQTIDFSSGQLKFFFNGNRSDLKGSKKLDSVQILSKTGASLNYIKTYNFHYSYFAPPVYTPFGADSLDQLRLRLDSVQEQSGATKIPPYSFVYNRNSQVGLTSLLKDGFNMDHWGYYNGSNNTHLIPSFAIWAKPANWGSTTNLIEATAANREPDNTTDASFTSNFSLAEVHYPTGGKSVFAYEPNDYDQDLSTIRSSTGGSSDFPQQHTVTLTPTINWGSNGTLTGTIDLSQIFPTIPPGQSNAPGNLTLDVAFLGTGNSTVNYHNQPAGKIYFTLTGPSTTVTVDISDQSLTGNSNVYSTSKTLSIVAGGSGIYTYTAYIDPSVSFDYFSTLHVLLGYQAVETDTTNYNGSVNGGFVGGGLRIRSVTDYSSSSVAASQRRYIYNYTQQVNGAAYNFSYGRLMASPEYFHYSEIGYNYPGTPPSIGYCTPLTAFGSSITSLSSVVGGNCVGYDNVTEMAVDPVSGQDIGKTVHTYFNLPDTPNSYQGYRLPGMLNMGNNLNGRELSKTIYKNTGNAYSPVSSVVNYFHTANRIVYFSAKYERRDAVTGFTAGGCQGDTAESSWYSLCMYPSIKSERVLLDSSVAMVYDQQNSAGFNKQSIAYYYDNPVHYLMTRSSKRDSKGSILVTKTTYPQDYLPNGQTVIGNTILDSLIGKNMVAEPIEQQDSLYYQGTGPGSVTGAELHTFRQLANHSLIPDKMYQLSVQSPVTDFQSLAVSNNTVNMDSRYRQMISFDRYDPASNVTQYTSTDLLPVTYIWDYSKTYPIAKVVNGDSLYCAYTSFEADGGGSWTMASSARDTGSITGSKCYNLANGACTRGGLVSGDKYIVSYWRKSTSPLSITGTTASVQGKTISGWTYFEHTVTGVATVSVSGTGDVDELRLYPATGQMNTYTYNPLIGLTSECSVSNKVTYYSYDGLGRLRVVRDQDGNIIKTLEYHYQGQ